MTLNDVVNSPPPKLKNTQPKFRSTNEQNTPTNETKHKLQQERLHYETPIAETKKTKSIDIEEYIFQDEDFIAVGLFIQLGCTQQLTFYKFYTESREIRSGGNLIF